MPVPFVRRDGAGRVDPERVAPASPPGPGPPGSGCFPPPSPRGTTLSVAQAVRSSRWSPTRIAFAIAVSAGFTAPIDGKTLVSTT